MFISTLAACVHIPQTPDEFKKAVEEGAWRLKFESITVGRDFDSVVTSIRPKADAGFNDSSQKTLMTGYQIEHSVTRHHCRTIVQDGKADIAIQTEHIPRGVGPTIPEGGLYHLVAEILRIGPQETKITIYGRTDWDDVFEAIKLWAKGVDAPCPQLK